MVGDPRQRPGAAAAGGRGRYFPQGGGMIRFAFPMAGLLALQVWLIRDGLSDNE